MLKRRLPSVTSVSKQARNPEEEDEDEELSVVHFLLERMMIPAAPPRGREDDERVFFVVAGVKVPSEQPPLPAKKAKYSTSPQVPNARFSLPHTAASSRYSSRWNHEVM